MRVTVEQLEKKRACKDQLELFTLLFPQGVELTRELIVKHAEEFDWSWWVRNLAGDGSFAVWRQAVDPARSVYNRACEPAWKKYELAIKPAWAIYNQNVAQARKASYSTCELLRV